jgi:hypothetical protein
MPVNTPHPLYQQNISQWRKCRDVVEGSRAVKAAGAAYLPVLEGQSDPDYDAYRTRALFYGVAKRTVAGLTGAITRRPSNVDFPKGNEDWLEHVECEGRSLGMLAQTVIAEVLTTARVGLLVDLSEDGEGLPYVSVYCAERIINWRTEKVRGQKVLTMVVLEEEVERAGADAFEAVCVVQYRVLELVEGKYTVTIYQEDTVTEGGEVKKNGWKTVEGPLQPTRVGGKGLDYIPFCFVTPSGVTSDIEPSPIIDLADANLSHYRSSADLEHGRHFTGLPTAWVAGFEKTTSLRIGSSVAWVSENPEAHAGFLEFTGQGLQSLENALKEKEQYMSILGSRLLEPSKKQVEATDTVIARQSGEQSMLANISVAVSKALTLVLGWAAEWAAIARRTAVKVELNKNFNIVGLDFNMVAQLMLAAQQGTLSWETFFWNLQRGELVPDDRTPEDEKGLISQGIPMPELNPSDPANQVAPGNPAGPTAVNPSRKTGKNNSANKPKKSNDRGTRKKTKQNRGA